MNNIIVTGATSMIGVALIEEAIAAGVNVYALVRHDTKRIERLPKTDMIHIVNSDLDGLKDVQIPVPCDALYHFAWTGTTKEQRDDPLINERNIRYTFDAVELAHRSGCKKFIGAGSQAEYGPVDGKISIDTKFSPVLSYGISKYAAGKLSRKLGDQYGMVHVWGRIFSVYGPHDNEGTMLNYAIDKFNAREIAEFSAATQKWNYLYESDAGKMFYLIGEKVSQSSTYNVANKESKPLRAYIEEIARQMNAQELCVFAEPDELFRVSSLDTCDERLFYDIGYVPRISFEEGIKIMIEKRTSEK